PGARAPPPPPRGAARRGGVRGRGRRGARRWGPRVLDLDIILWSGGAWGGDGLIIPHPEVRRRRFVLEPLAEVAPAWRDAIGGATVRQLWYRLEKARGLPSQQGRG
ncbi:MAG: 2-amino-4-hydroxy-6-hydroxymethyldihydropteridine diphosphokinase, partial [Allosphingosinicella sp.]